MPEQELNHSTGKRMKIRLKHSPHQNKWRKKLKQNPEKMLKLQMKISSNQSLCQNERKMKLNQNIKPQFMPEQEENDDEPEVRVDIIANENQFKPQSMPTLTGAEPSHQCFQMMVR